MLIFRTQADSDLSSQYHAFGETEPLLDFAHLKGKEHQHQHAKGTGNLNHDKAQPLRSSKNKQVDPGVHLTSTVFQNY